MDEHEAEVIELACRRANALGIPVAVTGFPASGQVTVFDVEQQDGEQVIVEAARDVPVTPSRTR